MKFLKLQNKRLEKGLTQAQVAEMIGLSPNSYCEKENGVRRFHHDEIVDLLKVLGCEYDDIF